MPEIIVKLGDNVVQKYFFVNETMSIGRSADNQIVIENLAVSRNHARILAEDGDYYVEDLGSSNGTFVNGVKIKKTQMMNKDVITLGKHKLYFYDMQQQREEVVRRANMLDADRTMVVSAPPLVGRLTVAKGRQQGQQFTLGIVTNIGRGPHNDIRLTDWFVSKSHATIEKVGDDYLLRDLGSWRHTFVNGEQVERTQLRDGDEITIGSGTVLKFDMEMVGPGQPESDARVPVEMASASQAPWLNQYVSAKSPADEPPDNPFAPEPDQPSASDQLAPEPRPVAAERDEVDAILFPTPDQAEPDMDAPSNAEQPANLDEMRTALFPLDGLNEEPVDAEKRSPVENLEWFFSNDAGPAEDPDAPRPVGNSFASDDDAELLNEMLGVPAELDFADDEWIEPEDLHASDARDSDSGDSAEPSMDAWAIDAPSAEVELNAPVEREADLDSLVENMAEISVNTAAEALADEEEQATATNPSPDRLTASHAEGLAHTLQETDNSAVRSEPSDLGREIQMWEKALNNKSPLIRKQAARKLKALTGKDYDY